MMAISLTEKEARLLHAALLEAASAAADPEIEAAYPDLADDRATLRAVAGRIYLQLKLRPDVDRPVLNHVRLLSDVDYDGVGHVIVDKVTDTVITRYGDIGNAVQAALRHDQLIEHRLAESDESTGDDQ